MLQCSKCKEWKDENRFYRNSRSKTWYKSYCKDCSRECYKEATRKRNQRNYYKNLEGTRLKAIERRNKNPQKRREWFQKREKNNKEYNIFRRTYYSLKRRCNNPKDIRYYRYWWRWIKCCWETFKDFKKDMWQSFLEHIGEYWVWRKNCQIDRINNDGNYCKSNCRWVTAKQNNSINHEKEFNS